VFWTHNDSGGDPVIFAVTAGCRLIARFSVLNADNDDWEAITADSAGNLYLGDIGNNWNSRRDLVVYRVPEPDPYSRKRTVRSDLALHFAYGDQRSFSVVGNWNYDAEALFWMDGAVYILTKHRADHRTTLYRLPPTGQVGKAILEPAAALDLHFTLAGNATGASLYPEVGGLAVLTYRTIYLFGRTGDVEFTALGQIDLRKYRVKQVEGIAWDGDDLLFVDEKRGLFRAEGVVQR
jgi:hypothetical protein